MHRHENATSNLCGAEKDVYLAPFESQKCLQIAKVSLKTNTTSQRKPKMEDIESFILLRGEQHGQEFKSKCVFHKYITASLTACWLSRLFSSKADNYILHTGCERIIVKLPFKGTNY